MSSDARQIFREVNRLLKSGEREAALLLLRDPLRRDILDPIEIDRAGKILARAFQDAAPVSPPPLRVRLLGQMTTTWLIHTLTAIAWGGGVALCVDEGEYDNVFQEVLRLGEASPPPDAVVLLPWAARLLEGAPSSADGLVEQEFDFWRQAWERIGTSTGARVIQLGYDVPVVGASGFFREGQAGGRLHLAREINRLLRAGLPSQAYFVDLERVAASAGHTVFYDPRRYFWTKQPFSEAGLTLLARHIWAGLRATITGPRKVLVVDLDNTLWGGIVGETGAQGIVLGETPEGEAYRAFQLYLRRLADRGVLLAVSSKNNPEDARAPFESHPQMVLRLEDFAAFHANWEPKEGALRRIAEELNLGLDSFVFFDDNPAEREHILQAVPEVEVVPVPDDPSLYIQALESRLSFETVAVTAEDAGRSRQYRDESRRKSLQSQFDSMESYLRSLEMRATLEPVGEGNLQRVVQLIGKTNQFNLTSRRHSEAEVRRQIALPGSLSLAVQLHDRFGDLGLVALIIGVPEPEENGPALRIDTWLMSCRVIGRTLEEFVITRFMALAEKRGYRRVLGEYVATRKNALVASLYERFGFSPLADGFEAVRKFAIDVRGFSPPESFVGENIPALAEPEMGRE